MLEYLKEEIKEVRNKVNFLRNLLLALVGGLSGIIFGISQNKLVINFMLIGLLVSGMILILIFMIRISYLTEKKKKLINKLKDL
jgi:hypothetical protein